MSANNAGSPDTPSNSGDSSLYPVGLAVIVSVAVVIWLIRRTSCFRVQKEAQEPEDPSPHLGLPRAPPQQPPPAVAVSVSVVEQRAGPILCTFQRAAGWREAMCPVCLSDFEDGETVGVLPACMHYFHAACVDEWLRRNATCALCRAAPPPASPAGGAATTATA